MSGYPDFFFVVFLKSLEIGRDRCSVSSPTIDTASLNKVTTMLISRSSKFQDRTFMLRTRVYPKVSELATWSDNCKWYSSLPQGAVVSLFCESA
jgi:hypothetical protein